MFATIVQHRVKDYATWKNAFDSVQGVRTTYGAIHGHIFRDAEDPNKLTILIEWKTLEDARKYMSSPEFKGAIAKAGTEGQPSISFLNEA